MNTKLHAVTDADGRPIRFFMTAGPPLGGAGHRLPGNGSVPISEQ